MKTIDPTETGIPLRSRRILWCVGIILLLCAQYFIAAETSPWAPVLLIPGLACLIPACIGQSRFRLSNPELPPRLAAVLVLTVILLAIPIRLYHLGTVPYGAHNDEIVKGMQVLKFFEGDTFQPFYVANKEFLFFYMLVPFVRYFGVSIVGLRALPFVCGLLTVLFTYLCFRRLWGRSAALIGAGFLAVGLWPNQSSHICERLNAAPMFTAAAFFLCVLAVQTQRTAAYILTGIVMGAGMWTFPTFRLIPWAVLGLLVWSIAAGKTARRTGILKSILTAVTFVSVTTAPLKFRMVESFLVFYSRRGHDFKIAKGPEQILEFIRHLIMSFNIRCVPDMSFTLKDTPLFWWPLGGFFIAGLIYIVFHWPRFDSMVSMAWLGAGLLPAVVSEPTVRRLTAAQPMLFGLIGIGVWITAASLFPRSNRCRMGALVPAFALLITAGAFNFRTFSSEIAPRWRVAWEDYWIVEAAVHAFDRFEVHVDWIEEEAELPLRYLLYPRTGDLNWFQPERPRFSVPFQWNPEKDFIYFFRNIPENLPVIPILKEIYPRGVLILHQNAEHPRGYYSFTMRRDDLEARRGVILRAGDTEIRFPVFNISRESAGDMQFPENCRETTVEGILLAEDHGRYGFSLQASTEPVFRVDDRIIEPSFINTKSWMWSGTYTLFLTAGPHTIHVTMPADGRWPETRLFWQVPTDDGGPANTGDTWKTIPSARWLQPPLPGSMRAPIPTAPASFQFVHDTTRQYPHPSGDRTYDIARIEALPDGTYIANCWHYQRMVRLNDSGDIVGEWSANLLNDPHWMLRFDFDVDSRGRVYISGDSRKWLFVTAPDGTLIRKVKLPEAPKSIKCHTDNSLFILGYHQAYRVSTIDGSVLNTVGQWGDGPHQYRRPMTVTADAAGNCYIADKAYNRIQVYDGTGQWLRSLPVPGPLDDSFGMCIDPAGNILVPHFRMDAVFCISSDGTLLTGCPNQVLDPLDSTKIRHPRFVVFPDHDHMWITNGDSLYRFQRLPGSASSGCTDASSLLHGP